MSHHHRARSMGNQSDDGSVHNSSNNDLSESSAVSTFEQPILVYHESARSIVFRDQLRRAVQKLSIANDVASGPSGASHDRQTSNDWSSRNDDLNGTSPPVIEATESINPPTPTTMIAGFQPKIVPLPALELNPSDEYTDLLHSQYIDENDGVLNQNGDLTDAEKVVCHMLRHQRCTVKTIKNEDWSAFLQRFLQPKVKYTNHQQRHAPKEHDDIPPDEVDTDGIRNYPFNSFVTSTSLLPTDGKRMRCYGSVQQYTVGVVFALPSYDHMLPDYDKINEQEDIDTKQTQTWSWPSGYSAKTEFNIDGRGQLINGRQEALRSLSTLRQYNYDYVYKDEYMVGNRMVSGLSQILYNEVYLRVGGVSRLVNGIDPITKVKSNEAQRSYRRGCGIPVALFVRSVTYGHLISLLRTRSRMMHILGADHVSNMPLLFIHPEFGVRVLTEKLQSKLWKIAASNLTPFQNSTIAYKTTMENTDEQSFQQKVDELIELDDTIKQKLTPEELGRLAGGFGATDTSVATILQQVMIQDIEINQNMAKDDEQSSSDKSHKLQDMVNEGLAAAVRSGDYHTSRQLLMLYSLVASQADLLESTGSGANSEKTKDTHDHEVERPHLIAKSSSVGMVRDAELSITDMELFHNAKDGTLSKHLPLPPPPPPLDTDRLRSATNSDGLLAVLGAAQVLKAMQDGGAKRRAQEVVASVEEWVNYGEQSMAFRISSWYDQRAAQGDLKIATENDTNLMAFVSNKAISNRKSFAQQIRAAVENTDFNDVRFLLAMDEILSKMHSPCLRLELLQYVLGLDNRYSVAHVRRSVELAASCLSIAASTTTSIAASPTE
jgi:hypothetical protein